MPGLTNVNEAPLNRADEAKEVFRAFRSFCVMLTKHSSLMLYKNSSYHSFDQQTRMLLRNTLDTVLLFLVEDREPCWSNIILPRNSSRY